MERNVNKEGDCEKNDCSLLTKSIIDQSSIEKKTGKCRHFSIRAYVAEIREKDRNICWPFHSVGDSKEPQLQEDKLPPLEVPEFRWWSCQNCLQSSASEEINCEGRKPNLNTSADMADYECYPVINLDRKEKLVDLMSSLRIDVFASGGNENSLVNMVDEGISEPTSCETKYAQCLNEESDGKDAEKIGLNFDVGQLDDPGNPNCGICEVGESEFGNINSNCGSNCSTETCPKRMVGYSFSNIAETSEQQREVITDLRKLEPMNVEPEVLDSPTSSTSKLSSLKFNEDDEGIDAENNLSFTSNTIKLNSLKVNEDDESNDAGNNLDQSLSSELDNASRNLNCRKPRKVRLLTDILKSEFAGASTEIPISSGLVISDNIDSNASKIEATDDDSDGLAVEKAIGKGTVKKKKKKKKRKRFPVEEWGPPQMRWSNSGSKNARMYDKDEENNRVGSVIASSATVNDSYHGLNSDVGFEKHSNKRRVDELALKSKKKYNKPQFDGRDGSCLKNEKDTFIKPKDVVFPCNYENDRDIQGNPEVSKKQPDERANKLCELEALDGIPIEIVELLAESRRRHRRFLESENANPNKIFLSETTNNVKNAHTVEFTGPTEDEMFKQSQEEKIQLQRKIISTCGGISTTDKSLEVGPTSEVESLNYPPHYKQTCTTCDFSLENRSGGKQITKASPGDKFGIQSRKYEGGMLRNNCSIVSCPIQCSEAHHVCLPNGPFVIDQTQSRNFEVPISKKKNKEQLCACVQKKIGKVKKQVGPLEFMISRSVKSLVKAKIKSSCTIMQATGCRTEICSVNRNPADFSIPGEGNKFMIGREDLKRRNKVLNGGRHSLTGAYDQKTMRTMK